MTIPVAGYRNPEEAFIEPKGKYIISVQSAEDPIHVKNWSVNINKEHYEGRCNSQVEVPGKVILTLYQAAVEKEEHEVLDTGMLRPTGNMYLESRWAIKIFKQTESLKGNPNENMSGPIPVGGVVLQGKYDDMPLEQLRKVAREKLKADPECGLNSQMINYATKKGLRALLVALGV